MGESRIDNWKINYKKTYDWDLLGQQRATDRLDLPANRRRAYLMAALSRTEATARMQVAKP